MNPAALAALIDSLDQLDVQGLRDAWRRHLGSPPPFRSRDLLRRSLAFEVQASLHGGLSAALKRRLRAAPSTRSRKAVLQPGTRLIRDWRGERHEVAVLPRGFDHRGNHYASLSEVARAITGARWSGPRFFGMANPNG